MCTLLGYGVWASLIPRRPQMKHLAVSVSTQWAMDYCTDGLGQENEVNSNEWGVLLTNPTLHSTYIIVSSFIISCGQTWILNQLLLWYWHQVSILNCIIFSPKNRHIQEIHGVDLSLHVISQNHSQNSTMTVLWSQRTCTLQKLYVWYETNVSQRGDGHTPIAW